MLMDLPPSISVVECIYIVVSLFLFKRLLKIKNIVNNAVLHILTKLNIYIFLMKSSYGAPMLEDNQI